jgi:hypothetical protein
MTDLVNSKPGKVPSTDGAPALPTLGGRIFGESPVRRAPIARHPPTRSDASEDEQGNLRDAAAPMAPTR